MKIPVFAFFGAVVFPFALMGQFQLGGGDSDAVEAELVPSHEAIVPGQSFSVGLRLKMKPSWHVYWTNPGSPGYAPKIEWTLPAGFKAGELQFPVPHRFEAAGYTSYGYEDEAVFLTEIVAPDDLEPGGSVTLEAKAEWLRCADQCIPGESEFSLELQVNEGEPWPVSDIVKSAREKIPTPVGWPIDGEIQGERVRFTIEHGGDLQAEADDLYLYVANPGLVDSAAAQEIEVGPEKVVISAPRMRDKYSGKLAADEMPEDLAGVLTVGEDTAYSLGKAVSGGQEMAGGQDTVEMSAAAEGWGYWLQRPLIVMSLIGLLMILALVLFGVMEVGVGLTGVGGGLASSSGMAGSFFSGALATILATPCTAPFMGGAIAYALGQPAIVTLIVFTSLGLGMSFPYLLLSCFPGLVQKLPRPGPWMETFKQAMGFPMVAVVAWLMWVVSYQITEIGLRHLFVAIVLLSLGAWWYGRFAGPGRKPATKWIARLVSLGLLVSSGWLIYSAAQLREPVEARDVEAQIAEIQEEGKGVFVDFTAAWCLTCQANKAFLHSEKVERALEENNIEFLEVDWTQRDPGILKVLQKYGREGVPLYLLFDQDPEKDPVTLPNLLTNEIIIDAIENRTEVRVKEELTLWPAILGAFIGGLILNLMPCVFPVISLKIMGFVNQAGEDRKKIFIHGLVFALGALTFFWILAGTLIAFRTGVS